MLYEINQEIRNVLTLLDGDENGEIQDFDELVAKLEALTQTKEEVLKWVAKEVFNTRAEKKQLKDEIDRLSKFKEAQEKKEARLLEVLNRECTGESKDLGFAKFSYRHSKSLSIADETKAIDELEKNGYCNCLKYNEPSIIKDEVKELIKAGVTFENFAISDNVSFSLR